MKRNKWAVLSTALTLSLLCGCTASIAPSSQHTVAIVAKSTQTEFWLSVFAGAEAAATEYNLELTITGPKTEEDYETQNQMVANAVEAGAEALVFSAIDYENNAAAIDAAAQAGVQIVAIDSNVASSAVSTYIGTDNYAAGQMAAQSALDRISGPLKVGIINYDISSARNGNRAQWIPSPRAAGQRSSASSTLWLRPATPNPTPPHFWKNIRRSTSCWLSTNPPA